MSRASNPFEIDGERKDEASARAAARLLARLGVKVEYLDRFIEDPADGETYVREIRIKIDAGWDGGMLFMVKAVRGGDAAIAFHGAETVVEGLTGLANRLSNGTLKWKEDKPYAG